MFSFFYCTHDFWVSHVFISCSCVFLTRAAHDFWVFHVVICCSWVFVFFKENCLLMTFKFVMFLFPAHIFIYKGYSWLLSFSCFCFLLTFLNKATHARFFFDSKATHAFWVSHVVICCSWVVFFHEGCSWFLSFSCFYFLFIFLNRLLIFFSKATHAFWISHGVICCSWVFSCLLCVFFLLATHDFWDSHDHCFLSLMSFYVFFPKWRLLMTVEFLMF